MFQLYHEIGLASRVSLVGFCGGKLDENYKEGVLSPPSKCVILVD